MSASGYRETLSFGKCPVCGGELSKGRLGLPMTRNTVYSYEAFTWYSDEKMRFIQEHPIKGLMEKPDRVTYADKSPITIPAGFCEVCNKIFPELDIRDKDDPIGRR